MSLRPKTSKIAGRNGTILVAAILALCYCAMGSEHRDRGYMYLSPVPGASHVAAQTRYILVRFENVSPGDITNLSAFIDVTGESSGTHAGQTGVAADNRTVIFEVSSSFSDNELVTVTLNPTVDPGAGGTVDQYQFQFMIAGAITGVVPGTITARGENPPDEAKENAFDNLTISKWRDLIVPNGSANFSWIQYVYRDDDTHVVNSYAITSANDAPERDPKDWRFYGVDDSDNLTLLDTQTGQNFASRLQKKTYTFTNVTAYRGYRLEITRVNDSGAADSVQLAEIDLIEPTGSILREYWTGIEGLYVTDLTGNVNYPDNPTGSDERSSFEAPVDWAEYYGTRMRGYITAPNTGSFVFWIATDDYGELWLSTDENPANAARIAYVNGWTNPREWNKYTSQKSAPIQLTAGQKYYVEALMKEHGGGDNLAVGWAKPGQGTYAPSEVIPGSVLSPWTGGSAALSAGVAPAAAEGPAPVSLEANQISAAGAIQSNGVSVPSDFPQAVITVNNNPAPGYIFLENKGQSGSKFTMILDNNGDPVWYRRGGGREFKVQKNGMITWSAFRGMDKNFNFVRNYYAANAHSTDDHELEVLEDGSYLIIGYHNQSGIDMSRYISGGNPYATVHATALQEFTAAGELIFQFRAWDHFDIADVEPVVENPLAGNVRFSHMNAIDVDKDDGHLLISSRHISEVTKIDRNTGEIIWRLSGAHSDFTFVNDPLNGFRNQHDISSLGNGRYMVFDNGNGHSPRVSRAVEYELDLQAMTATLVWEFRDTPDKYTHYMGNAQRLPNGNTLINFVLSGYPKVIEVDPGGVKQFEMYLNPGSDLYRAFRFPWDGVVDAPYLIVEPQADNITLIFNKFGDPDVAYYRIYGGTSPGSTTLLAASTSTLKRLTDLENGSRYYFRVTAVDIDGTESGYSNEENAVVNIIKPGQNMVSNGDFSQGKDSWIWQVGGSASASWIIEDGESHFAINAGGSQISNVQLRQAGMKLTQGNRYLFEFDAWCTPAPRLIEAKVGQDSSPWINYSKIMPFTITPNRTHYRFPFVMEDTSDYDARVVFNTGTSANDVYIDNVSLIYALPGDFDFDGCVRLDDLAELAGAWLREQSGLMADLDGSGRVDMKDFAIVGETWMQSCP